jgi:hypothetical protein
MTQKKLYFRNSDSEWCHEKEYFLSDMKDNGIPEMEVFEAEVDKSLHHFWCKAIDTVCSKDDDVKCGKDCEDYDPCNGKSGKCKFKTYCYTHGEKVTLKIDKP